MHKPHNQKTVPYNHIPSKASAYSAKICTRFLVYAPRRQAGPCAARAYRTAKQHLYRLFAAPAARQKSFLNIYAKSA
jgi:hypothetical protein